MLVAASVALGYAPSARSSFVDSARFERWSHFKDVGLPATVEDALNRAAIADGSCRLLDPPIDLDGAALWQEAGRVDSVLAALAAAPSTTTPSYFVRATSELLAIPCSTPHVAKQANFSLAAKAGGVSNWHHALCAPETDPSWKGKFDPAEEPQQMARCAMALTTGFLCLAGCDAAGSGPSAASTFSAISAAPREARDAVCSAVPWATRPDFAKAASDRELAQWMGGIISGPASVCSCGGGAAA